MLLSSVSVWIFSMNLLFRLQQITQDKFTNPFSSLLLLYFFYFFTLWKSWLNGVGQQTFTCSAALLCSSFLFFLSSTGRYQSHRRKEEVAKQKVLSAPCCMAVTVARPQMLFCLFTVRETEREREKQGKGKRADGRGVEEGSGGYKNHNRDKIITRSSESGQRNQWKKEHVTGGERDKENAL